MARKKSFMNFDLVWLTLLHDITKGDKKFEIKLKQHSKALHNRSVSFTDSTINKIAFLDAAEVSTFCAPVPISTKVTKLSDSISCSLSAFHSLLTPTWTCIA